MPRPHSFGTEFVSTREKIARKAQEEKPDGQEADRDAPERTSRKGRRAQDERDEHHAANRGFLRPWMARP